VALTGGGFGGGDILHHNTFSLSKLSFFWLFISHFSQSNSQRSILGEKGSNCAQSINYNSLKTYSLRKKV